MSEFEAKKLNLANINSGQKYQNGDGLQAKAFNALVEATLQNSNDIDFIDMILEGNNMYAELELSEAYTSRVTANGANIFDEQQTPVESIKGSTVRCKNLFDISKITKGWLMSDTGGIVNGDSFVSDYMPITYNQSVYVLNTNGGDAQGWMCFYDKDFNYISPHVTGVGGANHYYITNPYPNAVYMRVLFVTSDSNRIKGTMISYGTTPQDYEPYFAGLKHANINSIVSTGKNLFNKTAAMDITNWNKGTYNQYLSFVFKKGTHYLLTMRENNCVRENMSFGMWLYLNNTTSETGSSLIKIANASYTYLNKTSVQIYNENEDLYFIMYVDGVLDNQKLNTIFNDIFVDMMIVEGAEEIPYEPYIEHKYQLPQTVELAEFDTIYPDRQLVERYTALKNFSNETAWTIPTEGLIQYNSYIYPLPDLTNSTGEGLCSLFEHNEAQSDKDMTWFFKDGVLHFVKKGITTVSQWLEYISTQSSGGNPLILAYKATENTAETLYAPKTYTVYNGGTETVSQGEIDNSEYGAMPTITQTYLGKVGE